MNEKCLIALSLCFLLFVSGCFEGTLRNPGIFDTLLDTVDTLAAANVASSPVNPYAIPIGVGLSGLIGILEALRRKEKSSRQYAEHELKNNSHT